MLQVVNAYLQSGANATATALVLALMAAENNPSGGALVVPNADLLTVALDIVSGQGATATPAALTPSFAHSSPSGSGLVVPGEPSLTIVQNQLVTPFSPDQLSDLMFWLDFADTATITDAGAGAVSQVNDKGSGGRNFTQGTANRRPLTGTRTLNSLNVLDFTPAAGAEDYLEYRSSISFSANSGACTIYVVCRADTSFSTYTSPVTGDFSSDSTKRMTQGLRLETHTALQFSWFDTSSGVTTTSGGTGLTSATTAAQYCGIFSGSGTKHVNAYRNGVLSATQGTMTLTPRSAGDDWGVGLIDFADLTHSWDGIIGEVICCNADHDVTGDRATVEAYLAAKWGV